MIMGIRSIAWAIALTSLVGLPANADDKTAVPVHKVMLFSSGVGYFEHQGQVTGDTRTELRFKSEQINDLLKSLVLEDLDGGTIGSVVYPSQDPLSKTLGSFQVDISDNPPMAEIMRRIRGSAVTLHAQGQSLRGTVLGVEKHHIKPDGSDVTLDHWIVTLITKDGIRPVALSDVQHVELEDASLQSELQQALAALAQARDQDKKPLTIDFQGQGDRRVRLAYVVSTPVWKTSYRLIMPAEDSPTGYLQGWAIIENQTDSDWNDVALSLISGRPISFIQDLYEPLYIERPVVQPELYASLRPQVYEENLARGEGGRGGKRKARAKAAPAAVLADIAMEMDGDGSAGALFGGTPMDPTRSVAAAVESGKIGELFSYTVPHVSLPRQRSAMIPIVTREIAIDRVSIYNRNTLAKHPLNGARLTNNTGNHLLQGPITVFDGGGYAGDARIEDLPPDQNRLFSYAIDLELAVDDTIKATEEIVGGKIVGGVLEMSAKQRNIRTYAIKNSAARDRRVIVEHPLRHDTELVDTPAPSEKTAQLYRFDRAVAAGKTDTLTVTEERVTRSRIAILPTDASSLLIYVRNTALPKSVRDALQRIIEKKRGLSEIERQIDEARSQIGEITTEQERIRSNMRTVDKNTSYYNRLLKKLNDQETDLEAIRVRIQELEDDRDARRKAFEQELKDLHIG